MDLTKFLVFAAVFVLLLVLGRILSARAEVSASELPQVPEGWRGDSVPAAAPLNEPAMTGAEIGFPIVVPPVTRNPQGRYNRPYFLNYYFEKTDLAAGPPDPECFCDEFHLQAQDPESDYVWEYQYTVATPQGLERMMKQEGFASLYVETPTVIVSRWDLSNVLQTVVDEIMKSYAGAGAHTQLELPKEPERWA